jgi:hypothetical protein
LPAVLARRAASSFPGVKGRRIFPSGSKFGQRAHEYSFDGRVGLVEFTAGAGGVVITVTFDSEPTHSEEQQRTGWQAILDSFARHVKGKLASG